MAQRDPETYGTIVTRPDDFAAFWDETLADLARVPLLWNATRCPCVPRLMWSPMMSPGAVISTFASLAGSASRGQPDRTPDSSSSPGM